MFAQTGRRLAGAAFAAAVTFALVSAPVRADTKPVSGDVKATTTIVRAAAPSPVPKSVQRKQQPKEDPFLIIAFGSSSTQGVGASGPDHTYPAQAQQLFVRTFGSHPGVVVVNRGVGGEDIDDMMKRLRRDVLARSPDLVLWQAGSNDILRGVPLVRFLAELKEGVAAIRAAGAEIILIEPQWCPAFAKRTQSTLVMVEAMRAFAAREHVPLVRRYDLMHQWVDKGLIRAGDLVGRDGLHMTDHAYELLARAVFEQVRSTSKHFRATVAGVEPTHL